MGGNTHRYSELLRVPEKLAEEFYRYECNYKIIVESYNGKKNRIQEEFKKAEAKSTLVYEYIETDAERCYDSWIEKICQYKKKSELIHQYTNQILDEAMGTPVQSTENAIRLLKEETQNRLLNRKRDDNSRILELCESELAIENEIQEICSQLGKEAAKQRDEELEIAKKAYDEEQAAHLDRKKKDLDRIMREYTLRKEHEEEELAERVEKMIVPEKVKEAYVDMISGQSQYAKFESAKEFPQGILFGYAGYDLTEHAQNDAEMAVVSRCFGYAAAEVYEKKYLVMPYGYSFSDPRFSTMFEFCASNKEQVAELLRNLALNFYMSIPANKCRCTFIDPINLGGTFSVFSPIGEKDEHRNENDRVIDTKIWADEKEIEVRLKSIVGHMADVIQRCLQGRYDNIMDYNREAGINAEPLRFLMIMDFPENFTDKSISYLESIINNGSKTGVYTIIAANKTEIKRQGIGSPADRIRKCIRNTVNCEDYMLYTQESTREGKMRFFPLPSPTFEQIIDIVDEFRNDIS